MSEQTAEKTTETASEPVSGPDPATGTGTASETPTEPSSADPETFPAEHVRELREENAKHRTKAKRADALAARLVTSLAAGTGRLADPSDLPYSDDLLDDDGMPDEAKVLAAVDELLIRKPHLAATRPVGDVGQGPRGDAVEMVSLAELLRAGAG
jgi:hypothetical protein